MDYKAIRSTLSEYERLMRHEEHLLGDGIRRRERLLMLLCALTGTRDKFDAPDVARRILQDRKERARRDASRRLRSQAKDKQPGKKGKGTTPNKSSKRGQSAISPVNRQRSKQVRRDGPMGPTASIKMVQPDRKGPRLLRSWEYPSQSIRTLSTAFESNRRRH